MLSFGLSLLTLTTLKWLYKTSKPHYVFVLKASFQELLSSHLQVIWLLWLSLGQLLLWLALTWTNSHTKVWMSPPTSAKLMWLYTNRLTPYSLFIIEITGFSVLQIWWVPVQWVYNKHGPLVSIAAAPWTDPAASCFPHQTSLTCSWNAEPASQGFQSSKMPADFAPPKVK